MSFKLPYSSGYSFEVECEGEIEIHRPPGLPENLTTKAELAGIVTKVIFQSSVMHAAVNFLQFDYGCYAPNVPALLKGKIPTLEDKGQISEDDVKKALPGRDNSLHQAGAAYALSRFSEDEVFLLHPEEGRDESRFLFTEPDARSVFNKFQGTLGQIENTIINRNNVLKENGETPYEVLLPSKIPYGVAI